MRYMADNLLSMAWITRVLEVGNFLVWIKSSKYINRTFRKNSSKNRNMGSSFKDLHARISTMETDLNFDARFESYGFLIFLKAS